MTVSKDKTSMLLNIDKTLKAELEQLAKADGRSLTNYITNVLKIHVENTIKNVNSKE